MICVYKTLNLQKRYPELQQNNKPILPALSYFSGNGSAAIDKPGLTLFQNDACRHEAHRRPDDLSEALLGKREVQRIGLSIYELHTQPSAGPCPGFISFPNVGVSTRGWIVTKRTRSGCCGLLNRIDRI